MGDEHAGNDRTDVLECGFTYRIWAVFRADSLAIKQESHCLNLFALSFAESVHQLLQLCRPLDLEEDLVVVIGNFYVQMLGWWGRRILAAAW